jgi:hypothetical protein
VSTEPQLVERLNSLRDLIPLAYNGANVIKLNGTLMCEL